MAAARGKGLTDALLDRLALTPDRIEVMARGVEEVAALPDPVGRTLAEWERPNGLQSAPDAVARGGIGIIYESRPHVTADADGPSLPAATAAHPSGGPASSDATDATHSHTAGGLPPAQA